MACIYALEFPNGKMYIGQTRLTASARLSAHVNRAEKTKRNERLYNAWRKYGAPSMRVLLICAKEHLNMYEQICIKCYDTFKNGYNSTTGGDSPLEYTALRNKKIAASKIGNTITLGRVQSEEEKLKKSIAIKAAWADPEKRARMGHNAYTAESRAKISAGTKGKQCTAVRKAKISAALKGKKKSAEHLKSLSLSQKGRKQSPTQIEKARQGLLKVYALRKEQGIASKLKGRKLSEEHKQKILESRKKFCDSKKGDLV